MNIAIRARHARLDPDFEERLERRLRFALARFGGRIRRIRATLQDINGPRGGEDQHCTIQVSLTPSGSIIAEATDTEVAAALGRAADRAARRVGDALNRRRTMRARASNVHDDDDGDNTPTIE